MSTSVPASGPITLSSFRTVFTGPSGAIRFSVYQGATNGVPPTGQLKMSHFFGKSALGYASNSTIVDAALSVYGMLFKITCSSPGTSAGINFYGNTASDDPNIYKAAFQGLDGSGTLVQNNFNSTWGTEERITYNTLGITNGASWTLFLKMNQVTFKLYDSSRQQVGAFTNRLTQSVIRRITCESPFTVVRVLDQENLVDRTLAPTVVWQGTQVLKLTATDGISGDKFGLSMAASRDGTVLVVGSPYSDISSPTAYTDAGHVYTYLKQGSSWNLVSKAPCPTGSFNSQRHGTYVALSGNGLVMVVTQYSPNSARILTRATTSSQWTYIATITGSRASLSESGWVAAIGQPTGGANNGGYVSIYTSADSGATWPLLQTLDGSSSAFLGSSITLSADGNRLAVGAYNETVNGFASAGKVYVYTRSNNVYSPDLAVDGTGYLNATGADLKSNGYFGLSHTNALAPIAHFSGDAQTLMIGHTAANFNKGAVYFFTRSSDTGRWSLSFKDPSPGPTFLGASVAVSYDGTEAFAGAIRIGESTGGELFRYVFSGGAWSRAASGIRPTDPATNNGVGSWVSIASNPSTAFTGAYGADTNTGAVYIFQ